MIEKREKNKINTSFYIFIFITFSINFFLLFILLRDKNKTKKK